MDLKRFREMPDVMDAEEIRRLFEELIAQPKPSNTEEAVDYAIAMWEIADRQWHTYSNLDVRTQTSLDNWIAANWDSSSEKMTGYLLGVIANVGLPNSLNLMKRKLEQKIPNSVRSKIVEAVREFGATVGEPYASMKK